MNNRSEKNNLLKTWGLFIFWDHAFDDLLQHEYENHKRNFELSQNHDHCIALKYTSVKKVLGENIPHRQDICIRYVVFKPTWQYNGARMILEGQQQQRNRFVDMPTKIRIRRMDSHRKLSRWIPKIRQTNGPYSITNHHHNCTIEKIRCHFLTIITHQKLLSTLQNIRSAEMATVTTQASAAVFRPCASKTRFLTGSSIRLNREVSVKPGYKSFKVEAKKGEWLPGLASPTYLDGRCVIIESHFSCYIRGCVGIEDETQFFWNRWSRFKF